MTMWKKFSFYSIPKTKQVQEEPEVAQEWRPEGTQGTGEVRTITHFWVR